MSTAHFGYRASHLAKGEDYDQALARSPFSTYMSEVEAPLIGAVVDRLFPHGVSRYLDFACGTGRITAALESRAAEAYGVDVSESMVAQARARCRHARFLLADLTVDPVDLGHFDLVTAFRFFGNAEDSLRVAVLEALWRYLAPGGYLLVNNHRNRSSVRNLLLALAGDTPWGDLGHFRFLKLLRAAGFRPLRAYGVGAWFVRAALARPGVFTSRAVHLLEGASRWPILAPFCPDVVVLAQKPGDGSLEWQQEDSAARVGRRRFLGTAAKVGVGCTVAGLHAACAATSSRLPSHQLIAPPAPGPTAPAARSLITLDDLNWKGLCGTPRTGERNNEFGYTKGPFAMRRVNGERRLLLAAHGQSPKTEQGWGAADLFELRMPDALSTARPLVGGAPIAECSLVPERRWRAADWQNLGVMEPFSGIQIGAGWWDTAQQVLWYTTFCYYAMMPIPVLNAVALHDDGTCTRYGPWFFRDRTTPVWKSVCHFLTPIPASSQPLMKGRTHLMGACSSLNWGLGLTAVTLPPLRPAVSGRDQAAFPGNGNVFVIETEQDLSKVPLDGSVWLWVSKPPIQAYTSSTGGTASEWWEDWRYNTQPTSIRYLGANRWQVTGTQAFRVAGTSARATRPGTPSAIGTRLHWALTYLMEDEGLPIADFTKATSGLEWPYYFMRREPDYRNVQKIYDLCADPNWGTRVGEAAGVKCTDWNTPSSAIPDPVGGEGFWQASLDTVFTCVWVDRPTRHGVLMFGRQAYGATWYHYHDTYETWGIIDRATSDPAFQASYAFRAEHYRRVLFEYDPRHLLESAAGTRPHNANGMRYVNGGNWGARWPAFPLYREASKYPGFSCLHPHAPAGGGQMGIIDEATNELIVAMPELYSPETGAFRPLIAVWGLP